MKPALTVIIPTYNEEKHIEQAIACSRFADEVLVIDSFSTDGTVELVKKSGCRLLQRKFDNFSAQKNYALSQAKNNWILILDADEYLSFNLQISISSVVASAPHEVAYYIPFKNHFINRFIQFGTNGNKKKIRLFNRNFCHYEGLVHEQLIFKGTTGTIPLPILHFTFKDLTHFFGKKNSYSSLQAEHLIRKNKKIFAFHLVVKPAFRFLNELIFRLGMLDGIAGLTSTAMNGYGVLSRYVKAENFRQHWKSPNLQNYEEYTKGLMEEAKAEGFGKKKTQILYTSDFYVKPLAAFLKSYFIQGKVALGLEGYIISYLDAFKKFNSVLYHWLNKRNLK